MTEHYDRAGLPISLMDWAVLFGKDEYAIIQHNNFKDFFLSTVWLGLNHRFSMRGPPLIFETMIFYKGAPGPMWRYSTEEAARRHHKTLLIIMQGEIPKKVLSKKWTRREHHKLLTKLRRL